MHQGSPFDTPSQWSGRVDREIRNARLARSSTSEPEFSLEGWRRFAAIGFACSPGIIFLVVVLLDALGRA